MKISITQNHLLIFLLAVSIIFGIMLCSCSTQQNNTSSAKDSLKESTNTVLEKEKQEVLEEQSNNETENDSIDYEPNNKYIQPSEKQEEPVEVWQLKHEYRYLVSDSMKGSDETHYKYNNQGKLSIKYQLNNMGQLGFLTTYDYRIDKQMYEHRTTYNRNPLYDNKNSYSDIITTYDDYGRIVSIEDHGFSGLTTQEYTGYTTNYQYENEMNSNLASQDIQYGLDGLPQYITTYNYDMNGNTIYQSSASQTSDVTSIVESAYDEYNNLIWEKNSTIHNDNSMENIIRENIYENYYDDRGNLVYKKPHEWIAPDGYYYIYDDRNRLVEEIFYSGNDINTNTYYYYDDNDLLLLKMILTNMNLTRITNIDIYAYDYKNTITNEYASGYAYFRNKYGTFEAHARTPMYNLLLASPVEICLNFIQDSLVFSNNFSLTTLENHDVSFDPSVEYKISEDNELLPYDYLSELTNNYEMIANDKYSIILPEEYKNGITEWNRSYYNEYEPNDFREYISNIHDNNGFVIFSVLCNCNPDLLMNEYQIVQQIGINSKGDQVWISAPAQSTTQDMLMQYASYIKLQ